MRSLVKKCLKEFGSDAHGDLKRTKLFDYQKQKLNGKFIPFAGYEMPVTFSEGVLKEHLHCRTNASIFDVSHMGQVKIYGKDRTDFMEKLVVGDIRNCPSGEGFLSLILNDQAGIIDDTIITNFGDHVHMVVNGSNKFIDLEHMQKVKEQYFSGKDITIEYDTDRQLLALQGPKAFQVLKDTFLPDVDFSKLYFMNHIECKVPSLGGAILFVCRCGYTGEDGFEISVPSQYTEQFYDTILKHSLVKPAALGSRDSLRLEAGLCLHGNDMNPELTPAECTLLWTVRKGGKQSNQVQNYIGFETLSKIRKEGAKQKRVGFIVKEKGIIRPPSNLVNDKKEKIGWVSSGTYSPILQKGIGMAFVPNELSKKGTDILIEMKGKVYEAQVASMPVVETKYFRKQ